MKVQLWSYNYDPEPSGIAPLSAAMARALAARGHQVEVVAAHPHYPEPRWGSRALPYRESRDGIRVLRLPIWIGRETKAERIRQELSHVTALGLAAPFLRRPDVILAVSPSFPALGVVMAVSRLRQVPWVLWLQDILPDGATASGILKEGRLVDAARRFERAAYASASAIVVISDSFAENLAAKGVSGDRLVRLYNPATEACQEQPQAARGGDGRTVLTMGNVGRTQNLVAVTRAFQESDALSAVDARFVIAGDGVEGDAVRAAIETDRVRVTGVLETPALERELEQAEVAVVSQLYDGIDFNVPSKLMNFMARGLPVVAAVRDDSEVARIVRASGGGWVAAGADMQEFVGLVADALNRPAERAERGAAALHFARANFTPDVLSEGMERTLAGVMQAGSEESEQAR